MRPGRPAKPPGKTRTSWESPDILRAIIQTSPLAVIALDQSGRIMIWNEAAERMLGWRTSEVLGGPPPNLTEGQEGVFRLHPDQAARDGAVEVTEIRGRRKDGSPIDLLLRRVPIRDVSGETIGTLGLLEDITDRERTAEALRIAGVMNARLLREEQQRREQLDAVRLLSADITRELDLDRLLDLILHRAMGIAGAEAGVINLWDEATQTLSPRVRVGPAVVSMPKLPVALGEGTVGRVAATRQGLIVNDYRAWSGARRVTLALGSITATMAEPLLYRDRLVGVIGLARTDGKGTFAAHHGTLLRLFADQAVIAIQNAQMHTQALAELAERRAAEAHLQTRNEQLEAVRAVVMHLTTQTELGSLLTSLADQTHRLLNGDRTAVRLWRPEDELLVPVAWVGKPMVLGMEPLRLGEGAIGEAVRQRETVVVDDYLRYANAIPRVASAEATRAMVVCPLLHFGELLGAVSVGRDGGKPPFSSEEVEALELLAGHAAIAISQAQLYTDMRRRADHLARLTEVTRTFTAALDRREVAQGVLKAAIALLPTAAARLQEWDEQRDVLVLLGAVGTHDEHLPLYQSDGSGQGLSRSAMATRTSIVCEDTPHDPRVRNRVWVEAEGIRSSLIVPLLLNSRPCGVLSIHSRERRQFGAEEIAVFQALADHAAIAIQNARLFAEVRRGQQEMWGLSQRLVSAQEEERRRLSRELHDEAGQALTALRIGLDLIRGELPAGSEDVRRRLGEAIAVVDTTVDQIRNLAQALRPPALETLGLHSALEELCRGFAERTRLPIRYTGVEIPGVPDQMGIHLYRCLQEALTNAARHAQASLVRVSLGYDGGVIRLVVADDGIGWDPRSAADLSEPAHLGLVSMRERIEMLHGRLEILTRPGEGTRIVASVPWRSAQ